MLYIITNNLFQFGLWQVVHDIQSSKWLVTAKETLKIIKINNNSTIIMKKSKLSIDFDKSKYQIYP